MAERGDPCGRHPDRRPFTYAKHGFHVIAAIEGEPTARPFAALDDEDAPDWGVVAGVVRGLP